MWSDRVALVGQSSADEARAVQSARGVLRSTQKGLRSTRKGGVRGRPKRGEGAVNVGVDVGYARRRCDWQFAAHPDKTNSFFYHNLNSSRARQRDFGRAGREQSRGQEIRSRWSLRAPEFHEGLNFCGQKVARNREYGRGEVWE